MSEKQAVYVVATQSDIIIPSDRLLLQQMYRHLELSNRANTRMMKTIERRLQDMTDQD
jgi:hypothetical protein